MKSRRVHDFSGLARASVDMGARQGRPDDDPRQLRGRVLQLLGSNIYEQTLRVKARASRNQYRQPYLPGPRRGRVGHLEQQVRLATSRWSGFIASAPRSIAPSRRKMRTSFTASGDAHGNQLRGLNLNTPIGVFGRIRVRHVIEVVSGASMETYDLFPTSTSTSPAAFATPTRPPPKWNPKRTVLRVNYRHRRATTTPMAPSASRQPDRWTTSGRRLERHATIARGAVSTQRCAIQCERELGCQQRGPYNHHQRHRRQR